MQAALALRGDESFRRKVLASLQTDNSFRLLRLGLVEYNRGDFALARTGRGFRGNRWVAAATGGQPQRTIYDAQHRQQSRGPKLRAEGDQPTSDVEVNEAYDGLGATYNLYWNAFQRDSIDGLGLALDGYVHFGHDYDNAFWDGKRMNFGDGDGVTYQRFTISVDIMGHELTHGVTQYESNLIYQGQPGAINESISDVFGSLVKQYSMNQTADKADWVIGAGLFKPGVNGVGIRSMKAPGTAFNDPALGGKDPQPAHMKDYVRTFQDNGGVHINSGIPNKAFYLVATRIGSKAWEKAGLIWYVACTNRLLTPRARFREFAGLTLSSARALYGYGSAEADVVLQSWRDVGIYL